MTQPCLFYLHVISLVGHIPWSHSMTTSQQTADGRGRTRHGVVEAAVAGTSRESARDRGDQRRERESGARSTAAVPQCREHGTLAVRQRNQRDGMCADQTGAASSLRLRVTTGLTVQQRGRLLGRVPAGWEESGGGHLPPENIVPGCMVKFEEGCANRVVC